MTATGKTYGDALYDLAAEEALCDELLEQVKLLARLFRENPQYPALLTSPDPPGGASAPDRGSADRAGTPLSCQFSVPFV